MHRYTHIDIGRQRYEWVYALLFASALGSGKRGSVSQSRVYSVPSALALVMT